MGYASNILMIRPVDFAFNEQTAGSNAFQSRSGQENIQERALKEFDDFVQMLKSNGINVIVINDTLHPHTPDSIFPNNWISFHDDGSIFLYPMQAENRRLERRPEIISSIKQNFFVKAVYDLSYFEKDNLFLEGTGSMVLDSEYKLAYASVSPRTDLTVLNEFCRRMNYKGIYFHSTDANGVPVYHTNVMMCVGSGFAVICMDSLSDGNEREKVRESLATSKKEIIEISLDQLNNFAGNMIQLSNMDGELLLVMSESAFKSLSEDQKLRLEKHSKLIHAPLSTIERNGGGSARCMIAEINLPELKPN